MLFVNNLEGHTSERSGAAKHHKIYGLEVDTYSYFDSANPDSPKNIVHEGRLSKQGKDPMGKMID